MTDLRKTRRKLPKLADLLQGARSMLIVLQDGPDPDAIASAAALRRLANHLAGVQCSIAHGGKIARAENLALVAYLRPGLRSLAKVDLGGFDRTAMVDVQPGAGNCSLPPERLVDIVIDHHPIRPATRRARFTDVRRHYGATSTILHEYLVQAGIVPGAPLATALMYGIRSDTLDMGLGASQADGEALETLYAIANKRMLSQIQRGKVAPGYFHLLAVALHSSRLYGSCIICGLGEVDNPDMMAEMADLLLRHPRAAWTLCYGCHGGRVLLSLRSSDGATRAKQLIRRVVGRDGTGGGHDARAGGQIPLPECSPTQWARIERDIRGRMLRALKLSGRRGISLVGRPPLRRPTHA